MQYHLTKIQGDLGVQRGLLRWFLSLHSPLHPFSISPQKIGGQADTDKDTGTHAPAEENNDVLPVFGQDGNHSRDQNPPEDGLLLSDAPSVPPAPSLLTTPRKDKGKWDELPSLPTPFTPSINKTLGEPNSLPVPLPEGLSVVILKSRLDGKKKIKWVISKY
jgi:DNA-3-methyladenine glycosylase II